MDILSTRRLSFRPWRRADINDMVRVWGDRDVMEHLGGVLPFPEIEARLVREIALQDERGIQYWHTRETTTGAFVGRCGLRPYPLQDGAIEMGYSLVRAQWGLGYATEAAAAATHYAFTTVNASNVFAAHHPENVGSQRVLAKLGFQQFGERWYEPTGLWHPNYVLERSDAALQRLVELSGIQILDRFGE